MLWLYSYFYNHFDSDDFHLRAAKEGFDFLTKYCVDEKYDWFTEVTREGKPVTKFFDIYASIYMILGLGEYYKATGHEEACELAVRTSYRVTEIILSPTYQAPGHGPYYEPGTKRLGTWLHFLNALTPLLKQIEEPGIEKIARMCVRNMLTYHWQPDIGYAFEILQHDLTPHPDDLFIDEETRTTRNTERWVNNFHTMEAAWMIMEEALRVGNHNMFSEGLKFGRVHLEKCWVERNGRQGLVQFFRPDDPESFEKGDICKPYVIKEVFVLLLLALEHTGEKWAADWFDRTFSYSYETPLEWPMRDTLHQPRGVMFSLEILDRMIERNGRLSNFFDTV
jgi:mannose/cellobiose epimerase-like protein (N-acyl-D-glucosamine 2-epimerase family)